jgi:hypothetical protein
VNLLRAAPLLLAITLLAGCTTTTPGSGGVPLPDPNPAADGAVRGQGTVIQVGDAEPELCLGAIAESYPPQCSGPVIEGWDWAAVELQETSGDVTWGAYAVVGLWDGERFELTEQPIPLGLYDPAAQDPDPRLDPATPGAGTEVELQGIQAELLESAAFDQLSSWNENGYLFVTVIYDDGSLQEYVDERFGPDLVAILPALSRVD